MGPSRFAVHKAALTLVSGSLLFESPNKTEGQAMLNFDDASKHGKDAMDGVLKTCSEVAKGFEAIATESTEYSKRSFQDLTSHVEALSATRSVEAAFDLQSRYIKSAYESFFAQSSKISHMYAELAKSTYRPYEATPAKTTAVVVSNAA
jgi:hypothetical protein